MLNEQQIRRMYTDAIHTRDRALAESTTLDPTAMDAHQQIITLARVLQITPAPWPDKPGP